MCTLRELQVSVRKNLDKLRKQDNIIRSLESDLRKKSKIIVGLRLQIDECKDIIQVITAKQEGFGLSSLGTQRSLALAETMPQKSYVTCCGPKMRNTENCLGGEINAIFELDSVGGCEDTLSVESIEESPVRSRFSHLKKMSSEQEKPVQNSNEKIPSSTSEISLLLASPFNDIAKRHQSEQAQNEVNSKVSVSKFCFGKAETTIRENFKLKETNLKAKSTKPTTKQNYDLLEPISKVSSMLSLNSSKKFQEKETEHLTPESSKDSEKPRNKSKASVHNWLKKHAKWRRKTNCTSNTTNQVETEKRKRSIWRKGLSYVWSTKTSSSKVAAAQCIVGSTSVQNLTPFVNVYDYPQEQSSFASVAVQTPSLFMDYSFQHDPRSCIYAAQIEQAYLYRCQERMEFLQRFGAEHFVMANLQQAAVLEEQTRVARLNQCFFLKRMAESWDFRNGFESMECEEKPNTCDSMDIDPPSPDVISGSSSSSGGHCHSNNSREMGGLNFLDVNNPYFSRYAYNELPKSFFDENSGLENKDFTLDNINGLNLSTPCERPNPGPFKIASQTTTNLNRLSKSRKKANRKHIAKKVSPTSDDSAFSVLRKRFKRNAISAEPSSGDVGIGLPVDDKTSNLIPKSQK